MLGRVPLQNLRNGNMGDEEWARVGEANKILLEWKDRLVIIDDDSFMTPSMLRSRVRKNVRKYGKPSLILLDYPVRYLDHLFTTSGRASQLCRGETGWCR